MPLNNNDALIDYIMDADSILNEYLPSDEYAPIGEALSEAIDVIRNAKPVVQAEWEETPYRRGNANHAGSPSARFRCTHCKHRTGYVNAMKWDYCPYCGADMRGDRE